MFIILPIGLTTAFDVMLSNQSLVYISVTMYTIIKATSVVTVYFFTVLFGLEHFSCKVLSIVTFICIGLGMAIYSSTPINVIGIALCFGATACAGLRWVVTQVCVRACNSDFFFLSRRW